MKTSDLLDALHRHYRKPGTDRDGEILLTEAAAPDSDRRIDLLRIGLWPSRGYGIDGHELKVSRSDWLRELDDPAKADAWWPYVHRWWIVAPDTDTVRPDELPTGWGLMLPPRTARGRRFRIAVAADEKEPRVDVGLLVEVTRRTDNARLAERDELLYEVRQDAWRRIDEARQQAAAAGLTGEIRERLDLLDRLEARLGVALDRSPFGNGRATPEDIGDALVAAVNDHLAAARAREQTARILEGLQRAGERLQSRSASLLEEVRP